MTGPQVVHIDVAKAFELVTEEELISHLAALVMAEMVRQEEAGIEPLFYPILGGVLRDNRADHVRRRVITKIVTDYGHTPKPRPSRDRMPKVEDRPERPEPGNFHRIV